MRKRDGNHIESEESSTQKVDWGRKASIRNLETGSGSVAREGFSAKGIPGVGVSNIRGHPSEWEGEQDDLSTWW